VVESVQLAPATSAARRNAPDTVRVLIVDDNADAADMFADFIESLGYIVRKVHDGPAALRVAAEFEPAVALLDIGLPVMDGYELAGRLRELAGGRIKLIAVTGYGQEGDRERAKSAGFQAHLVKPVDLDALAALLGDLAATPA
jgi:CheY-like chemotaxis protein